MAHERSGAGNLARSRLSSRLDPLESGVRGLKAALQKKAINNRRQDAILPYNQHPGHSPQVIDVAQTMSRTTARCTCTMEVTPPS